MSGLTSMFIKGVNLLTMKMVIYMVLSIYHIEAWKKWLQIKKNAYFIESHW